MCHPYVLKKRTKWKRNVNQKKVKKLKPKEIVFLFFNGDCVRVDVCVRLSLGGPSLLPIPLPSLSLLRVVRFHA